VAYSNKCPVERNGKILWEKREIVKEKLYKIHYNAGDIVGHYDIVEPTSDNVRTETIDAVEDSFIIFVPKS
jgi:hypothetical protein